MGKNGKNGKNCLLVMPHMGDWWWVTCEILNIGHYAPHTSYLSYLSCLGYLSYLTYLTYLSTLASMIPRCDHDLAQQTGTAREYLTCLAVRYLRKARKVPEGLVWYLLPLHDRDTPIYGFRAIRKNEKYALALCSCLYVWITKSLPRYDEASAATRVLTSGDAV